jgi:transcriptional regulator with XRE-family HTH domain
MMLSIRISMTMPNQPDQDFDLYNAGTMAGRPASTPSTEHGERLAALRKAAGLSQAQLADAVGIPARSVTFYERKALSLPSHLVTKFSTVLGVPVEQVLGVAAKNGSAKRGPKSELERRLENVRRLPRTEQKRILQVVDALLAQHAA